MTVANKIDVSRRAATTAMGAIVMAHKAADRNFKPPVRTKSTHLDALGCA